MNKKEKRKKKKCWQCKEYTVTIYKNEFGVILKLVQINVDLNY